MNYSTSVAGATTLSPDQKMYSMLLEILCGTTTLAPTTTTTTTPAPVIMRDVIIRVPCGGSLPCGLVTVPTTASPDDCGATTPAPCETTTPPCVSTTTEKPCEAPTVKHDDCEYVMIEDPESESCEYHDNDHHYKIRHNVHHHPRNSIWEY